MRLLQSLGFPPFTGEMSEGQRGRASAATRTGDTKPPVNLPPTRAEMSGACPVLRYEG